MPATFLVSLNVANLIFTQKSKLLNIYLGSMQWAATRITLFLRELIYNQRKTLIILSLEIGRYTDGFV